MKTHYSILLLLFVFAASCKHKIPPSDPIPTHNTFTIESKQLDETRTNNVWTPHDYDSNAEALPVMYMLDVGLKEDFPHIANTIDQLIQEDKIGHLILVGIEITQSGRDLTGPTNVATDKEVAPVVGGSENFILFIREELFPEINKRYKTKDEKSIIGESLAGLFVLETFLKYPNMLDYYIAFDLSLWWNNPQLIKTSSQNLAMFPSSEKRIWLSPSKDTYETVQI